MAKKFRLSLEQVQKIVATQIVPKYPQFKFEVYQSKSTESVYVRCGYNGTTTMVRISTHPTIAEVQSVVVGKSTKVSFIINSINNAVSRLKRKRTYKLLEMLEERGENNDNIDNSCGVKEQDNGANSK